LLPVLVAGAIGAVAAAETPSVATRPAATAAQPPSGAATGTKESPHSMPGAKPPAKAPPAPVKKVDINNASVAELKAGLQVSDDLAKKIVEHRPYKAKGELMTRAGLPEGVYQAVKRKVELQKPRKAAAKK
jgi:DNA uptake protein ComE-like DNA-binding protein